MSRLAILIVVVLVLSAAVTPLVPVTAQAPDYDIPGGHFYTQANGQGGAGGTGFSITDEGGIPFWSEFQRLGGVPVLGYVASQRFTYKGFVSQATQKYILQWQPQGSVHLLNVFDELTALGKDAWLEANHLIPRPSDFDDSGKTFQQIAQERLTLLDSRPAIKAAYLASADPLRLHGLPTSPIQDMGPAYVVRNQRDAIQEWKIDTPWAKAGEVTIVNGGDLAKEAGLVPAAAAMPQTPPGLAATPTPTPTPTAVLLTYPYNPVSLTWEPNCGLTQIKVYLRDEKGFYINNVRVVVASAAGGWSATSVPTGQEGRAPGWTDVVLRQEAVAGTWNVWVIDEAGKQASPVYQVVTNDTDCGSGGSGHQVASLQFVKGAPAAIAPSVYPYIFSGIAWEPNCGLTRAKIFVIDEQARPVDKVRFHIESEDGSWSADSFETGYAGYAHGWTDFFLRNEPAAGNWRLWAIDAEGNRLSDTVRFATDAGPCQPGEAGHQVATIQFTKVTSVVTPTPVYQYSPVSLSWAASCTLTQVNIYVRDKAGNPVDGVKLHIETDGAGWEVNSAATGSTDQGPGWTSIWLRGEPFAVRWNLWVIDQNEQRISKVFTFDTQATGCSGSGHQIATVTFVKNW
jgi:hypothetical protein